MHWQSKQTTTRYKKTLQYWNRNQYEDRKKTSSNTKKKLRRQY